MNIRLNREITEEDLPLFRQMEDFLLEYLEDKRQLYSLSIELRIYADAEHAMRICTSVCNHYHGHFLIWFNQYSAIRMREYALRENCEPPSARSYLYFVLFHELGHIAYAINHPETVVMIRKNEEKAKKKGVRDTIYWNPKEENWCTKAAEKFVLRHHLNRGGKQ